MKEKIKYPLHSIAIEHAISQLSQGAHLITAHALLTSEWKHRYMEAQHSNTCQTPAVFSWSAWVSEHYRQHSDLVCLNALQEKLLWEKIIATDLSALPDFPNLKPSSIRGLAQHASSAYLLMQNHQIKSSELEGYGEEAHALQRWISKLQLTLKQEAFKQRTLTALMPHSICQNMASFNLPEHIICDGFATFTPMQQQVLQKLEQHGVTLSKIETEPSSPNINLTTHPDENAELQYISKRIDDVLSKNQHARIAIVSTSTSNNHDILQRHLNQSLMSDMMTNPSPDMQAITMPAQRLSDGAMIQQLLHVLALAGEKNITFEDFSTLLFSPWTHDFETESMQRATLDALFRRQNRHRLSFKGLLQSPQVKALPALHHIIESLSLWTINKRPSQQWIKDIHTLLQQVGFIQAGLKHETPRSNFEIRQMNAFRDALTSLIAVDAIEKDLSWTQCLSLLRIACSDSSLSLPAKYPNVIMMPLHQIAGLHFDHVFLLGMDETNFPPAAQPQPLLPIRLQQKHHIPMSHASNVFESSTWLWQQLQHSTPIIEISYALQRDEQEMPASSFISTLTAQHMIPSQAAPSTSLNLESFDDKIPTPVQKDENIRGGTSIIRNQSACPFRAFANHRLGITSLGETAPGIEATTKGSLIHLALEFIWQQLTSQAALLALEDHQKAKLIDSAINHACSESKSHPDFNTLNFEKKRMQKVLNAWLSLETIRPAFKVLATEKEYHLQLPEGGRQQFPINITADRLDQDAEGHHILLDYKTGSKQSPSKWLGERMEEPQLPIYAMAANLSEHDAMSFAMVRSGHDMGFEGLSGEDVGIKGLTLCDGKHNHPENWQDVLDHWKIQINALAQEFVDGRSDVRPRDAKACSFCNLEAVCRIEETGFVTDMEDDT